MSENKDTEYEDSLSDETSKGETKARRPRKTSTVDAATKEPTQESVDPVESAEPAVASTTPYATVSGSAVDPILYSRAVPTPKNGPRKSLTVYHLQRRLYELGHTEAWSETIYGKLTRSSVSKWQESAGYEPTGVLTRGQFTELFSGDPNVSATVDTIADNPVE